MYVRAAPALFRRMLLVGGVGKVYKIEHQFQNEEIDLIHSPESTTYEFYLADADYRSLLAITR